MILRTTRDLLRYGSLSALAASLPAPAIAQAWPSKPIKIVRTYPAGGLTDIFARAYGEYVAEKPASRSSRTRPAPPGRSARRSSSKRRRTATR